MIAGEHFCPHALAQELHKGKRSELVEAGGVAILSLIDNT